MAYRAAPKRIQKMLERRMGPCYVLRYSEQRQCWQIWVKMSESQIKEKGIDPEGLIFEHRADYDVLYPGPTLDEFKAVGLSPGIVDYIQAHFRPIASTVEAKQYATDSRKRREEAAARARRFAIEDRLAAGKNRWDWVFKTADHGLPKGHKSMERIRTATDKAEAEREQFIETGITRPLIIPGIAG
jgi:hypothetical protein